MWRNDRERERIRLITMHEGSLAHRILKEQLEGVVSDHAAKGRLHSGATIKVSVRAMQTVADAFLDNVGVKIRAVAEDPESFALMTEAMTGLLNECSDAMPDILKMARGGRTAPENDSIGLAGMQLFNQMRADMDARLAILACEFESPTGDDPRAPPRREIVNPAKVEGRPRAAFWDDLWAAIAVALYVGELIPKTQADIERAIADWLDANGHSAAESTIRARARRLWDGISASGP